MGNALIRILSDFRLPSLSYIFGPQNWLQVTISDVANSVDPNLVPHSVLIHFVSGLSV